MALIKANKRIKWVAFISIPIAMLFLLPSFINSFIEHKIKEKLKELPAEMAVSFSSVHSNISNSSVAFTDLHIRFQPYKQLANHHDLYAKSITVGDIGLFNLLWGKTISVNRLQIGNTEVKLDSLLLLKKDSAQTGIFNFAHVQFDKISIHQFAAQETSIDIVCNSRTLLLTKGKLTIDDMLIDSLKYADKKHFHFGTIACDLREFHYTSPISKYSLHTGNISLNTNGRLLLDSLHISASIRNADKDNYPVKSFIQQVRLSNVDVQKLVEHKLIEDSLQLAESEINVYKTSNKTLMNTLFSPANNTSFPLAVSIKHFNIRHSHIHYNNKLKAEGNIVISNLQGTGNNGSIALNNFHFSAIHTTFNNIVYYTGSPARIIKIGSLTIDSRQAKLLASNITVHTVYSKEQLANKLGFQEDWINASIKTISLQHPDINTLLHSNLTGDKLLLHGAKVYVYRDRRLPRKKTHQLMPVDFIKQLPIAIRIHTLEVKEIIVEYDEMPKDGFKDGILRVQNIYLKVTPFINHPKGGDPDYIHVYSTASVMGLGNITTTMDMPLKSSVYHVKGAIQNLDLTTLNSSAENLGKFHIQSGILNNLAFNFSFTSAKSTGKIVGEYHDLVVQKLNKKRKKALLPSLALRYIIIPKNKDKSKPISQRTGEINYARDDTRFITYFLVKSLLSGIRSSFTFGFLLPK